jgi:subtilisin family serine protease
MGTKKNVLFTFSFLVSLLSLTCFLGTAWAVVHDRPSKPEAALAKEKFELDYKKGELLVKFRDTISPAMVSSMMAEHGLQKRRHIPNIGVYHVKIADGKSVPQKIEALKASGLVEYAEPNYKVHAMLAPPDDPKYPQQWALPKIDAPGAWDTLNAYGVGGVVAVIDTGADIAHPDLAPNIWTNPGEVSDNGVDDDVNGYVDDVNGWDFFNGDNDPTDDHGHGTHVSGTIAAVTNNGTRVAGINGTAKIMPLKFLGADGSGSTSDAILAIQYAVNNGAKISNNSWGGGDNSQALKDVISWAGNYNHLFCAAAGNDGGDVDDPVLGPFFITYPAAYDLDNIISVAATDSNDNLASFSNYGTTSVDIAAPGVSILSTLPTKLGYGAAITVASFGTTSSATGHGLGILKKPDNPGGGGGGNPGGGGGSGGKGKKKVNVSLSTDKLEYVSGTDTTCVLTAVVTAEKGTAITGLASGAFSTELDNGTVTATFDEENPAGTYHADLGISSLSVGSFYTVDVTVTDTRDVSGTGSADFSIVSAPSGGGLVYMAFGFEVIDDNAGLNSRQEIMQDVLNFLLGQGHSPNTPILLVADDGDDSYEGCYTGVFNALGYTNVVVHQVPTGGNGPGLSTMEGKVVLWETGDEPNYTSLFPPILTPTLTSQDQGNLTNFLNNGGKLFLTGEDIGWDLVELGNGTDFYANTLHAKYLVDGAELYRINGVSGSAFHNKTIELTQLGCAYRPLSALWPSGIAPADASAAMAMEYDAASDEPVASWNGTSMATPHVSAVASLIRGHLGGGNPGPAYLLIKSKIMNSAVDIGLPVLSGGVLNANEALK